MPTILRFATFAALVALCAGTASAQTVVMKSGAVVETRLDQPLSSKTNHSGDTFTIHPISTLFHRHDELKGTVIDGHIENVTPAGPTHKATMTLIFDDIQFADGHKAPVAFVLNNMKMEEPKTHHVRDVGIIVGSAVAGKMLSNKTGHKGGTLAGAAAGFAIASSMKSDIKINKGTQIELKAKQALVEPAN